MVKIFSCCMIGSILLHAALFLYLAGFPAVKAAPVRAIEAYVVDLAGPDPARNRPARRGTDAGSPAPVRGDIGTRPIVSPPVVIPPVIASPAEGGRLPPLPPVPVAARPDSGTTRPESMANAASVGHPQVRRPEGEPGGRRSVVTRQSVGAGPVQVMALGDSGSPSFLHREPPIYPVLARKLGREGRVLLRLRLDPTGHLQGVETVEAGGFGFAEAAISAIRKSTFMPAVRNGDPVASQVLVPVRFVLYEGK